MQEVKKKYLRKFKFIIESNQDDDLMLVQESYQGSFEQSAIKLSFIP